MKSQSDDVTHHGSCHCQAVKFSFETPLKGVKVSICNCSICRKKGERNVIPGPHCVTGFEHLVVPKSKFTLETPWDAIKTYAFGTGVAKHYFCGTCGISPFYVPRSNPNGYSVSLTSVARLLIIVLQVNFRCVDDRESFEDVKWDLFDGQNWEEAFRKSDITERA